MDDTATEELYVAGGCLWGVQAFVETLPGVVFTEAGRANGTSDSLDGDYDGYAECVRIRIDPAVLSVDRLMTYLFEIIDPYSVNRQGPDVGEKYRTGLYSENPEHLDLARAFITARDDAALIAVEVLPLTNYVRSADEHQDRLARCPDDSCHLPRELLDKYRTDKREPLGVGAPVPVLRMFDEAAAREFYVDYLRFDVQWEHRFEPGLPLYMRIRRGSAVLDLSEHHGDGTPGSVVWIPIVDADAFHADLGTRPHRRLRPGIDRDAPGGPTIQLTDPSGNELRFCESAE